MAPEREAACEIARCAFSLQAQPNRLALLTGLGKAEEGTSSAPLSKIVMRVVHRLDEETLPLRGDLEAETASLHDVATQADYQRYLVRWFGFISPLERSLLDTSGLGPYLDTRRLRKHELIEHDLHTLGLRPLDVRSIPQCMWIPWFDNPLSALGWAYLIERNTLAFPNLFRHLANVLPGEAAFAASYLKIYGGATSEMWKSFAENLEVAASSPENLDLIAAGALAGCRHFRRWRSVLDGKSLSNPPSVGTGASDES